MSHISRAYKLNGVQEVESFYDDWAATYDKSMSKEDQDYVAPSLAAAYLLKHLGTKSIHSSYEILDAGCGTGLAGIALTQLGAQKLDGVDLSPGMLDIARKTNIYRHLNTADLSTRLVCDDNRYDAVCCVGTLTHGHVGPQAIDEFVRVVKPGGLIVATVLDEIYESGGYLARIEKLVNEGRAKLLGDEKEDYRRNANLSARMVVLQVTE